MTMIEMTFWKKMFGRLFCLDKAHYPIVFYASYIQIILHNQFFVVLFLFLFRIRQHYNLISHYLKKLFYK